MIGGFIANILAYWITDVPSWVTSHAGKSTATCTYCR